MPKLLVAPSMLSANFLKLSEELKSIEDAGADWHHVDVMDGHFVPNLSFGLPLIEQIHKFVKIPLDVHIMISNPQAYIEKYIAAGASRLTFHVEASNEPQLLLKKIRQLGAKAGISLNPNTDIEKIYPLLNSLDQVLVMSVFPGFGGQKFIEESIDRINMLSEKIRQSNNDILIVVDGGVQGDNVRSLKQAGADVVVSGSYIYKANNRQHAISSLKI